MPCLRQAVAIASDADGMSMAPAIMIAPKFEAGSTSVPASVLHQLPAAQDLAKTLSVRSLGAGQRSGIGVCTRSGSGGGFCPAHDAPPLGSFVPAKSESPQKGSLLSS